MKTLNLVYPEKSDIKYTHYKFPDGQQNISIDGANQLLVKGEPPRMDSVKIKSRLNNWKDLELIVCTVASLKELFVKEIHLYVPYIVGARSDRKFSEGGNNYLKDVICPILNSLDLASIICMDPHSDCLEMGLKHYYKESNSSLIRFFKDNGPYGGFNEFCDRSILISPDAGASKKIYPLTKELNLTNEIIVCSKDRDHNGKLTRTIVPISGNQHNKDLVIIDDICDGGATFINIVQEIRKKQESFRTPPNKIYLIVTHGIFSKGFSELSQYFDGIYCTNSYSDLMAVSFESNEKGNHKVMVEKLVKQLNVF